MLYSKLSNYFGKKMLAEKIIGFQTNIILFYCKTFIKGSVYNDRKLIDS